MYLSQHGFQLISTIIIVTKTKITIWAESTIGISPFLFFSKVLLDSDIFLKLILVNFKVYKISFQLLSSNSKIIHTFAFGLLALKNRLPQLDEFFHGIWRGSLRRAEYGGVIIRQSSTKRDLGGKSSANRMQNRQVGLSVWLRCRLLYVK